jgi:hypothetical protein
MGGAAKAKPLRLLFDIVNEETRRAALLLGAKRDVQFVRALL